MAFRFKQFTVNDERSSMKVGTDAVLLGAWAGNRIPSTILDIGTGCGLIALMMAQRFTDAKITAIDIHERSVEQSGENFKASRWPENLSAELISLQELASGRANAFDLIISNPPFFSDSLLPPDPSKKIARHTETLSFQELVEGVNNLLKPGGHFALILPMESHKAFSHHATKKGFLKCRELEIIPVKGKKPNRILSEWTKEQEEAVFESLCIRKNTLEYTDEYKKLTEEFYLAL